MEWLNGLKLDTTTDRQVKTILYRGLDEGEAEDFDIMKFKMLKYLHVDEDTYRKRYQATTRAAAESWVDVGGRASRLYARWMKDLTTREEVMNAAVRNSLYP